eukprot:12766600-Prorocentrum_lima.AAC.1
MAQVEHLIQTLVQKQNFNQRVDWEAMEKEFAGKVRARQRQQVEMSEPEDHWLYYEDYIKQK